MGYPTTLAFKRLPIQSAKLLIKHPHANSLRTMFARLWIHGGKPVAPLAVIPITTKGLSGSRTAHHLIHGPKSILIEQQAI
jgi:hypothetical protein